MKQQATTQVFGHSLPDPDQEKWEPLADHLADVGLRAGDLAAAFGWRKVAEAAGRLHDIGKTSAQFQNYIRGLASSGGDHATAGARQAINLYGTPLGALMAAIIAGHHSGLADADAIERRLRSDLPDHAGWEAHAGTLPTRKAMRPDKPMPGRGKQWIDAAYSQAFLTRMLFSCLVDADFIATETFMRGGALPRGGVASLAALRDSLRAHMDAKTASAEPSALNTLRGEILDHAVAKAGDAPGFFTMSVPTGGGKTLASLAFALEHAVRHGLRRVVVVIPFTAIIEQTAQVYRDALGDADAVLEHHSGFDWEAAGTKAGVPDGGDAHDGLGALRRAAENWDSPIVVTTSVQFFESLYANRTSRCRKLHNLAQSVIVLDEAQTIPGRVLLPCLAALDELRLVYGATVVLCTATQPAWRAQDAALIRTQPDQTRINLGLDIPDDRELAPRPRALFEALRRVRVEVPPQSVDDAALAHAFAQAPQMLCIVNSRAHARAVYERIAGLDGAVHLTTLMCAVHRRVALANLKARLKAGLPVRLVATSLIEAGVDISFPEVWRASAGLDSIAQAAGRCNREGELLPGLGRVVVFHPATARPPAALRGFQQAAAPVLRDAADPLSLASMSAYFRTLYFQTGADALDATQVGDTTGVLAATSAYADGWRFPFESIGAAFRLTDDAIRPVFVPYGELAEKLLDEIAAGQGKLGVQLRALQGYVVGIPENARADWLANGELVPLLKGTGDVLLRLRNQAPLYQEATGLDLSDGVYRRSEDNVW